jgi:hypothetical protein
VGWRIQAPIGQIFETFSGPSLYDGIQRTHGVVEPDNHINGEAFAVACAEKLRMLIGAKAITQK